MGTIVSPFYFMKRILFVLSMLIGVAYGQSVGYWRYDTVVLQKIGGNSELKIMNATRAVTGGVLTNMGNGRTAFVTPSGGSTNTSLGGGLPVAITGTNNVKSLLSGLYVSIDSATANSVKIGADTANMFPAIRATIPVASIPASSIMGEVVTTTFPGVSIPSGFSQLNGTATISYSSGLNMSGGTSDSYNDNYVKSTFISQSNNYQYTTDFTIVTKPTAPLQGLVFEKLGQLAMYVTFKHFTTDSGKLVMRVVNGLGAGTAFDSTGNVGMADGGTYRITIAQSNNTIFFKIQRLVAGLVTETKAKLFTVPINTYYQLPSIGSVGVSVLGGSYTVTSLKQTNYDIISSDVVIVGTSISQGYSPTSFENHYIPKAFEGSGKTFVNFGAAGGGFSDFLTSLRETRLSVPDNIGVEGGVNDACGTLRQYASEWIDSAIAITGSASKVFWIKDFSTACKDTIFANLVKEKGIVGIDPWVHMTPDMFEDGVHPNDLGGVFIAKYIKQAAPQFFGKTGSPDQYSIRGSKDAYFSGLTNGQFITYNSTTGKWNNTTGTGTGLFINNQQASAQTANYWITGSGSLNGFLGVGTQATSSAKIQTEETDANGLGIIIRNNSAASGATKVLQLVVKGGSAAEGSDWNNAGVVEAVPNGGLVFDAYVASAGIKFQLNRTRQGIWNSSGFGIGGSVVPTHQLTVNGQVRVTNMNSASVFDSVLVINDGVIEKRLASTLVTTVPLSSVTAATATNSINNGDFEQVWEWNTLSSNAGLQLISSSTAATTNNQRLFQSVLLGANANASQTTYAGWFANGHTGTSSTNISGNFISTGGTTNIAGKFSSSSGTNNYAIITNSGSSGFGNAAPTSILHTTSFATAYRALTALRTLDDTDHTIEVTANTFSVTLPTAVGITGRQYVITNSGAGTTTIATTSSQTFVNVTATPTTLTVNQFSTVTVVSNGANWLRTSSL